MNPRPLLLAVPVVLLLFVPSVGEAQQMSSFRDLALRVNVGDRLRIQDQSGAATTGRLVGLTATELVVGTPSGTRRFGLDVASIAVRRSTIRKAVLIGAGLGAVAGTIAACSSEEREECGDAALMLGAVGAGAGVLVSALHPSWTTVHPPGGATTASAGEPGPLDPLALHVNLGDRVRVRTRSGTTANGQLTRLTGDEMTLATEAGEVHVDSAAVRTVAVRRYALGRGALIGAATFTVLTLAAPACRENSDCVPLVAASFGAGVGVAIGALVPRMSTVFRAEEPAFTIVPAISRRGAGVRATLRW